MSWENCKDFNVQFIQQPTSAELKKALANAYRFQNKDDLILLYAWNEFDEGGFIEPTLTKDGLININKLETIKEVVDNNKRR